MSHDKYLCWRACRWPTRGKLERGATRVNENELSSNRDGTLTVVEEKKGEYQVLANVMTQNGARTMALDPKTHNVYLVTAKFKAGGAAVDPHRSRIRSWCWWLGKSEFRGQTLAP